MFIVQSTSLKTTVFCRNLIRVFREFTARILMECVKRAEGEIPPTHLISHVRVFTTVMEVRVLDARNIGNELEVFPSEAAQQRWTVSSDRVELTRGALLDNSEAGIVRLVFMAFDRLEEILQPQAEPPSVVMNDDPQPLPRRNTTRLLNSKVISASLGKGRHIQLSEPVRVYFRHLAVENVTNPTCVFWDYILR